ncbi:uncharacterized protein LOC107812168 isoform X2 [Nicotiana tabacum]|uniref:Uncharacterized protein LOC107812168 isoform X2 n=1 Tax=Nicotiana tabacum TaxID=4097 RepID=A0AC58SAA9_TOBAC
MDTLSTSVSSLKVPTLRRNSADLYSSHFNFPNHHLFPTFTKPSSKILNKTNSFIQTKTFNIPTTVPSRNLSLKQSSSRHQTTHTRASSGYAAALVDIAKSNNSLETLERDVIKLSKWLRKVPFVFLEDKEKGYVLKEILSKGKFHKHLVGLLKLLVEKNKVGIVNEVLMEFERIYDQICGTQVVLVSSDVKMEKDKVFGIAKKVQELSGAEKLKVKVSGSGPGYGVAFVRERFTPNVGHADANLDLVDPNAACGPEVAKAITQTSAF